MRIFDEFLEVRRFNSLPERQREIVFYAESKNDWPHFMSIVRGLVDCGKEIAYVTSDSEDPILCESQKNIMPFCIGFALFARGFV